MNRPTVCVSGAGVDSAWEQKKLEASLPWRAVQGKMLDAKHPPSTALKMMAGDHFIRRGEDLHPENALLGCLYAYTRLDF